jgi:hypothetical protein
LYGNPLVLGRTKWYPRADLWKDKKAKRRDRRV